MSERKKGASEEGKDQGVSTIRKRNVVADCWRKKRKDDEREKKGITYEKNIRIQCEMKKK